jgi:hypothetical protein
MRLLCKLARVRDNAHEFDLRLLIPHMREYLSNSLVRWTDARFQFPYKLSGLLDCSGGGATCRRLSLEFQLVVSALGEWARNA